MFELLMQKDFFLHAICEDPFSPLLPGSVSVLNDGKNIQIWISEQKWGHFCHFYLASNMKLDLILDLIVVAQAAQMFLMLSHLLGRFWLS